MSRAIKLARAGYSGDPGLFGWLGTQAKKVTGFAGKILPGPLGAAARTISGILPGKTRPQAPPGLPQIAAAVNQRFQQPMLYQQRPPSPAPRVATLPPLTGQRVRGSFGPYSGEIEQTYGPQGIPGAQYAGGGGPADGTVIQRDDIMVAACPQGYRPNKSSYYEMSLTGGVIYHPPGTKCVKVQKRNPANARANDRAISRIGSAKRYAKNLSRVSIRPRNPCHSSRRSTK